MPNLRIVYDNVADDATLTASTTAGGLGVANLKTDIKSEVWRSTSTTASLTAEWTDPEVVGCVALPFCSLTSTATIRVRGYTNAADPDPLFDTGTELACAYAPFGLWDWGMLPLGVNAYAYGGAAYGVIWFDHQPVRKVVIDLVDADNDLGYVEASRLVIGAYWSPEYNATDASAKPVDTSKHERSDAGDLKTDRGTQHNTIPLDLAHMTPTDRARMWQILRGNGKSRPVFLSVFPECGDPEKEQAHQVYGKLSDLSALRYQSMRSYGTSLEVEEI